LEVAARLGGGHDAELCEATVGVDLAALAVQAALGERVGDDDLRPAGDRAGLVRFLVARPGTVTAVRGVDEARALPGVVDALVYRQPGDVVGTLSVGADRAGYVLAVADERDQAEAVAGRGVAAIEIATAP
jgi:biotin carboxylase